MILSCESSYVSRQIIPFFVQKCFHCISFFFLVAIDSNSFLIEIFVNSIRPGLSSNSRFFVVKEQQTFLL